MLHAAPPTHQHVKAFRLMYYANEETREGFWVWNARDGVTPSCVFERGLEFRHVEHGWDRYDPDYQPRPNQRYFRNRSLAEAMKAAILRLELLRGTEYAVELGTPEYQEFYTELVRAFLQAPKLDRWAVKVAPVHLQLAA